MAICSWFLDEKRFYWLLVLVRTYTFTHIHVHQIAITLLLYDLLVTATEVFAGANSLASVHGGLALGGTPSSRSND